MRHGEMDEVADAIRTLACSITPISSGGGKDASGGFVKSLTEAVMGITSAGMAIADAIHSLADSIDGMNSTGVDGRGFSNPTKEGEK